MKNKILFLFGSMFVLLNLVLCNYVQANNNNNDQTKEAHQVGTTLSVSISDTGKVRVEGAKVTAVSGTTVNTSTVWGSVSLNFAVNISSTTKITGKLNKINSSSGISVGDIIGFQGDLVNTSLSPIIVNATLIKNSSFLPKNIPNLSVFNGFVKSMDMANNKFILNTTQNGDITVVVSSSTKFKKGDMVGLFTDIATTSRVLVKGFYDSQLRQFQADEVKVYIPRTMATEIVGTIKSLPNATLPTSMVITSENKDYTVNIATDTSVLNSTWLKITLSSLKVGNKVKIYGVINTNMTIDATVIRNIVS